VCSVASPNDIYTPDSEGESGGCALVAEPAIRLANKDERTPKRRASADYAAIAARNTFDKFQGTAGYLGRSLAINHSHKDNSYGNSYCTSRLASDLK
jgi:hypothetical protein